MLAPLSSSLLELTAITISRTNTLILYKSDKYPDSNSAQKLKIRYMGRADFHTEDKIGGIALETELER